MIPAKARGQSAVLIALVMPFLVAFVLLVVEVSERWLEVSMLEDALQQATRSAAQLLSYADLARGAADMRADHDCRAVAWDETPGCRAILSAARDMLLTNLTGVRGLNETPDELAERVRWTVLPAGGTCSYSSASAPAVTETSPLLCAEVRPHMRGVVGWGDYTPLIIAADTLDIVR
jgi:hypothetical protein